MLGALKYRLGPAMSSWIPLGLWHRMVGTELLVPRYHAVGDCEAAHIEGLHIFRDTLRFRADMEYFLKFYRPVSLQDVIDHLDGTATLPERCLLPTFDDGFSEVHDVVAPILASRGVPAVFFLNTGVLDNHGLLPEQKKCLLIRALKSESRPSAVLEASRLLGSTGVNDTDVPSAIRRLGYHQRDVLDKLGPVLGCDFGAYAASARPYLTSEQTAHLIRQGFAIGAHSVDHPLYAELSLKEQLAQTRQSVAYFAERHRYECQAFAFPYSDAGISEQFFRDAFRDGHLKVSFGTRRESPYSCARHLGRFKMEYDGLGARQILARELCLTMWHRISSKDAQS